MDVDTQPRAFVAQQQIHDLFLIALLSTHPEPDIVIRQFRKLVAGLTAGTATGSIPDESFVAAVRRSASRFDGMVQRLLPATRADCIDAPSTVEPATPEPRI